MKQCPFCAESIQDAAIVCRFCSADLVKGEITPRGTTTVVVQPKELSAGVAAVLSLFIPGAGQMYCGRVGEGLAWLIFVAIGYAMFIFPGVILHIICIFGALTSANQINARQVAVAAPAPAKVVTTAPTASAPARASNRGEVFAGGALAVLVHPITAMRIGRPADRALVAVIYALGSLIILRAIWLQAASAL